MSHNASSSPEEFDWLMPEETEVVQELVRRAGAQQALEIGMARGSSAVAILSALPSNGHLTSIDPFQLRQDSGYGGAGVSAVEQAGFSARHTLIADYDYLALPRLLDEGRVFQFIFIDGYHAYDYAMLDFFYANLLLSLNGIVAFHDSGWPSIHRVCNMVEREFPYARIGPPPARQGLHWTLRGARLAWHTVTGRGQEFNQRRTRFKSVAAYQKHRVGGSLEDDGIDRYRIAGSEPARQS